MVTKRYSTLYFVLAGIFVLAMVYIIPVVQAVVTGGTVTPGTPGTAPADAAGTDAAYAGNVTELTISGYTTTQAWQGYFGNVTGVIQLADSSDNVLYNWTLASPEGEVYASSNSSITWTNIQCFNFTATGSGGSDGTGGTTNTNGTNVTQLETTFNIAAGDVDGVDETFTLTDHDEFFTASQQFSADECVSTRVYGDTGAGVDQEFEEVLLFEPTSSSVVYASILEEADTLGFDNANHDFEMLVLEDGHGVDVATTTYNFYVELE